MAYYSLLADVYASQKKYAEAETALQQAIRVNQTAPGPYVGLATLYVMRGDTTGAVDVLQQGLGANAGDSSPLLFALAAAYQGAGDKAIASLFQWHRRLKGYACFQRHMRLK
jgi:Flp pilus assembly protein TadD